MKDISDKHTIDFVGAEIALVRGQVLMDRQRHIAIVAKKSEKYIHLVRVQANTLKLSKLTPKQLATDWSDTDYPFENAVDKLIDLGNRHGITESARRALEVLQIWGKEPLQYRLFSG